MLEYTMARLTVAALVLLLSVACGSSSDPSSAKPATTSSSPKTTAPAGDGSVSRAATLAVFLREAEQWNDRIAKQIRYAVLGNEPYMTIEQSRQILADLQGKALASFANAERTDPQNAAVYKARARMRWNWLGASMDMNDTPGGSVRRERTDDVNKTLQDLSRAIALDPNDSDSLILRGRVVLLEWVEPTLFHIPDSGQYAGDDVRREQLREFGVEPSPDAFGPSALWGVGGRSMNGPLPAVCDRAIADLSLAIQTHTNEAQGYYWRSRAFWYKVLLTWDTMRGAGRVAIEAAVKDDLDQAKANAEQARFLMPQNEQFRKQLDAVSRFSDRLPINVVATTGSMFRVKSAQEIFADAAPAVVLIRATSATVTREGSGSVVSRTGLVLTNRHVVEGARTLTVTSKAGRRYAATIVAFHEVEDLALIRVAGDVSSLPVLTFASQVTHLPSIGDDVVMIGHPIGMEWTLTAGKVSQFRGSESNPGGRIFLQTDAAINPGNSGGPILDMRGFIVAVASFHLKGTQGLAFGVYTDVAEAFVRRYK